jgi:hypothetical protein
VHTGIDWQNHDIRQLNAVSNQSQSFTWDILSSEYSLTNWICGSMNGAYSERFKGRFLPDPWSTDIDVLGDDHMVTYYNYVCQTVQKNTRKMKVSSFEFGKSLLRQGVSVSTLAGIFKQLITEKLVGSNEWKRAMWLDRIQLDVFSYYYKKDTPEFATFFSNAVAHFQHHFWSDFEPEKFGKSSDSINKSTGIAILEAYKNTDFIVGKLLKLVGDETTVLFTTALSQEPYLKNERFYYHIHNESSFFENFKIPSSAVIKPLMAEQFLLELPDEGSAITVMDALESYQMDGNQYFHVGSNQLFLVSRDERELLVQCRCTKEIDENAKFHHKEAPDKLFSFYDAFYVMNETKTGVHNPIGLYWTKTKNVSPQVVEKRSKPSQIHHDILAYFASS